MDRRVVQTPRTPHTPETTTTTQKQQTTIRLGGSWNVAQEANTKLEREKTELMLRCGRLQAEVEALRRESVKGRAEAAAHEAKRVRDQLEEAGKRAELADARDLAERRQELILMAGEDFDARFRAKQATAKILGTLRTEHTVKSTKLDSTIRKLHAADASNRDLIELRHRYEKKITKLDEALNVERKAKDVLLHAKNQKEKHIVLLIKERDRLRAALHRSGLQSPENNKENTSPPTPASSSSSSSHKTTPTTQRPVVVTPRSSSNVVLQAASIQQLKTCLDDRDAQLAAANRALKKAHDYAFSLNVRLANKSS